MIQLETTITHTEKKMLTIQAPSFWKCPATSYDEWIAVVDEKTFIRLWRMWDGELVQIEHCSVERRASEIIKAQKEWNIITEQEFFQNYDDAWESMRLKPQGKYLSDIQPAII